jgi:asparagine synthase (glutamine-hydrolysing)
LRGDLRETLCDVLSRDRIKSQGLFRPEAVQALWEAHRDRRADYGRQLWTLLVFSLWHDRYLRR